MLTTEQLRLERLCLGMRTRDGISLADASTGLASRRRSFLLSLNPVSSRWRTAASYPLSKASSLPIACRSCSRTVEMVDERHVLKIVGDLGLKPNQVKATAALLDEGATIPFIARYRKEATGSLDEVAVAGIRDTLERLRDLDKRRESILKTLEESGKLTDELKEKILAAETLAILEDVYLPYRPKRRTRAAIAKEKGLEPLAERIFSQDGVDPAAEAAPFVNEEKGVGSVEEALAGARDIIAEWVNEDEKARTAMRSFFASKATFRSKVVPGKEEEGAKFRDYFDWEEPVTKAPSHRVLALRRGEHEEVSEFARRSSGG